MTRNEQARADAMADAETLRLNDGRRILTARAASSERFAWLMDGGHGDPAGLARFCAHRAFRSVPGLRGDR